MCFEYEINRSSLKTLLIEPLVNTTGVSLVTAFYPTKDSISSSSSDPKSRLSSPSS